jgi:hypothetical protein
MRKITIIAIVLAAFCGSAAAQVTVETDNKVGQPGAAPKAGPGPSQRKGTFEKIEFEGVKRPGIVSPRDSASGLPTGKR